MHPSTLRCTMGPTRTHTLDFHSLTRSRHAESNSRLPHRAMPFRIHVQRKQELIQVPQEVSGHKAQAHLPAPCVPDFLHVSSSCSCLRTAFTMTSILTRSRSVPP